MFDIHLTANLLRNLPVKKTVNRLRFDRIMVMSLWPNFFAHPVNGAERYLFSNRIACLLQLYFGLQHNVHFVCIFGIYSSLFFNCGTFVLLFLMKFILNVSCVWDNFQWKKIPVRVF